MKTEIKKRLYKQKPKAFLKILRMGVAYYECTIAIDNKVEIVNFEIPISDMGNADFYPEMEAKLLNRWIVIDENTISK